MGWRSASRRGARAGALAATVSVVTGIAVVTSTAASAADAPQFVRAQPVCDRAPAGHAACQALRLVRTGARTPGARPLSPAVRSTSRATGPAGGYTPTDLATAYGLDPNSPAAKGNILAVVDAYHDPRIRADLNAFDARYRLPTETPTSFRVVGQDGSATLPAKDVDGWSVEEALDVESARAVCRLCRIVLVETRSDSFYDLAAGVNTAVRLGADEISNSYGGTAQGAVPTSIASAYDHKKVVITASTGDDGWHDWDWVNEGYPPGGTAEVPSSLNTVVGVGGTTLRLNADGTRASEQVWNENGPGDKFGYQYRMSLGATGGGCSPTVAARNFQRHVAGYASLGCGARRSATDIAAIADPYTGFDVLSTFDFGSGAPGWVTAGGTSLAAPVVAAMWALAGGAHNIDYPALTLYGHLKSAPATYDVHTGGNGACDTLAPSTCKSFYATSPNTFWRANVDCGFSPNDTVNTGQCYARKGYDGPSGVGAPRGLTTFTAMAPRPSITGPSTVAPATNATFVGGGTDPFPYGGITSYAWAFGDGATATGATANHAYAHAGTYTVTLRATDDYGVVATTNKLVTVS